jgi:carboxymethylenebutenolidase
LVVNMVHWAAVSGCATEPVQWTSDGAAITGFLAKPTHVASGAPALVILHEWWGLGEEIKALARRFAREGYVALAPDLYSRQGSKVAAAPQEAAALMTALSSQQVLRDLNAGVRWLKSLPAVDGRRIGLVGFGMGGTLALTQAAHNSDLKAVVVFYGKVPPVETFRYLLCPVQYHYAAKDGWVTKPEVDRLREGMAQQGKTGVVHTYADADQGFFNEARRETHRAEDAALAWERMLAFLAEQLGA